MPLLVTLVQVDKYLAINNANSAQLATTNPTNKNDNQTHTSGQPTTWADLAGPDHNASQLMAKINAQEIINGLADGLDDPVVTANAGSSCNKK